VGLSQDPGELLNPRLPAAPTAPCATSSGTVSSSRHARSQRSWQEFARQHADQMLAVDFFTVETVWLSASTSSSSW
jgi:hypothetical protein